MTTLARMSSHGSTRSNVKLFKSFVDNILLMTPYTLLMMPYACWVLTVAGLYLIPKLLISVLKSFFNSLPLLHIQCTGRGYRDSQSWFISWDTFCELKSSSGMCPILNQLDLLWSMHVPFVCVLSPLHPLFGW